MLRPDCKIGRCPQVVNNIQVSEAARKKLADRCKKLGKQSRSRSGENCSKNASQSQAKPTTGRAVPLRRHPAARPPISPAAANASQALTTIETCHMTTSECEFSSFCCGIAGYAAEFRVSAGITDLQVFQRDAQNNTADIKIGGTAKASQENQSKLVFSLVKASQGLELEASRDCPRRHLDRHVQRHTYGRPLHNRVTLPGRNTRRDRRHPRRRPVDSRRPIEHGRRWRS